MTLVGGGFTEGCDDGGDIDYACSAPKAERSLQEVDLLLRRNGEQVVLGTADAAKVDDDFGHIEWTITIPEDAALGRAALVAEGAEPLSIAIVEK